MPGCPKHTKGLVLSCPQCKKINNLLTKVAKDTVAGRKIQYFHPFKKEDVELKIQQLADEAKAQEASPFCMRHFPNGGVRCHACLSRQLTEQQCQHRDAQAAIFGLSLPIRAEEFSAADAMLSELRREHVAQTLGHGELTRVQRRLGYMLWSVDEFVSGVFAQCDPDKTGVVFLHDVAQFAQTHPPRLIAPLTLDGATVNDVSREMAAADTDQSGGLCRTEMEDVLFIHGMQPEQAKTVTAKLFQDHGITHPDGELSLANVYTAFMQHQRQIALSRLKKACLFQFQLADEDKDGYLSLYEVRAHHTALLGGTVHRAAVDEAFRAINVSKTGLATPNELFSYYYHAAGLYNTHDMPQLFKINPNITPQAGPPLKHTS